MATNERGERRAHWRRRAKTGAVGTLYSLPLIIGAGAILDNDMGPFGHRLNDQAAIAAGALVPPPGPKELSDAMDRLAADRAKGVELAGQGNFADAGKIATDPGHLAAQAVNEREQQYEAEVSNQRDQNGATTVNIVERGLFGAGVAITLWEAGSYGVARRRR